MSATRSMRSWTRSKSPGIRRSSAEPPENDMRRRDAASFDIAFARGYRSHFHRVRHDLDCLLPAEEVVVRHEHQYRSAALRDDDVIHRGDAADKFRPIPPRPGQ